MSVVEKASSVGQSQVFKYLEELSAENQQKLKDDVASLPLDKLDDIFKGKFLWLLQFIIGYIIVK